MFGVSKKLAASMAELLIILAIIGILSVMYRKTVNEDAIAVKYGYKTLMNDMIGFAATETNSYERRFPSSPICESLFRMANTLGGKNCVYSVVPVIPNLTITSGMRFFGLEQTFQTYDKYGEKSVFIQVDLDGLLGKNQMEEDIFPFELMQSGRMRPSGSSSRQAKNIARDSQLLAVNASYVPSGATTQDQFLTIGNRISYAEAQCLSGNIFPYRDVHPPHKLQMCVENATVRNAINAFNSGIVESDRTAAKNALGDKNGDGVTTIADRDEEIRLYRLEQATNNTICSGTSSIYNHSTGIAKGQTPITAEGATRCGYCYKIAYIRDYCSTETERSNDARCPATLFDNDSAGKPLIEGMCSAPQWLENIQ